MANKETIRRVLDAVGIKPKQLDLVDKVLSLESDNKRVHSIDLHHGTIHYLNLWADVLLLKNFESMSEFTKYLYDKGLPKEKVDITRDKKTYILINEGVRIEFRKPGFYPQK